MSIINHRLVVVFAFLVPFIGVVAPKGIVIALAVPGFVGLWLWLKDGRPGLPVSGALVFLMAALAAWAVLSSAWALSPSRAFSLPFRLAGLALAGVGLLYAVTRLDSEHWRKAEKAFLVGMALGLTALAVGFGYAKMTGTPLWSTSQADPLTTLNTGAVAISLLAWPAFALLWRRGHKRLFCVMALVVYAGFTFLASGAALLSPVMGIMGFQVVWIFRRRGALAIAAVTAVVIMAAPQIVSGPQSFDRLKAVTEGLPASAEHRMKIWDFVVEKIDEKPLWGWGMDASRSIPKEDKRLSPEIEILPLHPHNAFLQVRLELGIPGAILFAALVGAFFAKVVGGNEDRFAAAVITGAAGAYLTVASVSYGIWQNWWFAFAWALAVLTAMAVRSPP